MKRHEAAASHGKTRSMHTLHFVGERFQSFREREGRSKKQKGTTLISTRTGPAEAGGHQSRVSFRKEGAKARDGAMICRDSDGHRQRGAVATCSAAGAGEVAETRTRSRSCGRW